MSRDELRQVWWASCPGAKGRPIDGEEGFVGIGFVVVRMRQWAGVTIVLLGVVKSWRGLQPESSTGCLRRICQFGKASERAGVKHDTSLSL